MSGQTGEYVPSPRPNPRLRPEGAAYAERNRGTMERWFDYSDTFSNADGNKAAGTAAAGDGVARTEVEETGTVHQDQSVEGGHHDQIPGGEAAVGDVTEKCSQLSMHSTPAEEAREYALRNRGQMDHVINNYRASPPPPISQDAPPPTVTQGTETGPPPPASPTHDAPQSPRDSARQRSLHQESQGRTWEESRPAPRIRPDGESIALKNSSDSMFDIMRSDSSSPQSSPAKTPVRSNRNSQEIITPTQPASQPRTRPGDGLKNYERAHDQSEMAAILRGEGDTRSAQPRNIRHLQRSELW